MPVSPKTAAVYDRWLHTLGGGEQLAFAYAEALRDLGYKTVLLTHREIDIEQAERKLHVDLKDITIVYIPHFPDFQLSHFTEKYDVFVSNSYLDYIPNLSKFGILSVFFPSKISVNFYEYLKRKHIVPSLRRLFIYPTFFEGFRYDEFRERKLHKWLSKNSSIILNSNISKLNITLHFEYLACSCFEDITFYLDTDKVSYDTILMNRFTNEITYSFSFMSKTENGRFRIELPDSEYSAQVSLTRISIPSIRYWLYNAFKRLFPKWEMRLHGGPSTTRYSDIESYDEVTTISKFSSFWLNKYWKRSAKILYPPVTTHSFKPSKHKRNTILHVGRFFVGGHSKKQLDLIRVFKELYNQGVTDWELHLVGSVASGEQHAKYLEQIREEKEGYPVFLHLDAPFVELRDLLANAKLYWHATGLDEDDPMRLEHFGITTVEAMASGCVPLVINKGGQSEIVTEESGFVWDTREELIQKTKSLISDPKRMKQMSAAAVTRSQFFSKEQFRKGLSAILPKK